MDEVLASPPGGRGAHPSDVQLVHRRCGGAVVLGPVGRRPGRRAPYHRIHGPIGQRRASTTTTGCAETAAAAWEAFGFGPGDFDMVELHDATSAEELYALESLGFFGPARPGRPPWPATPPSAASGLTVNPSGGLVGRGHPLGATGIAQVVELATQLRGPGRRAPGRGRPARGGRQHRRRHRGRCGLRGHPRRGRREVSHGPGHRPCGAAASRCPTRSLTNDDLSARLDTSDEWITERTGIRERRIGGTTSGLAIEAGRRPGAGRPRARATSTSCVLGHHHPRRPGARRRRPPCRTSSASPAAPSTSTPPARASSTAWWPRPA